jgi:excinuclease ABC subunit B
LVIMYADKITKSMQTAIEETDRRRAIQIAYNLKHGITPTTILKGTDAIMKQTSAADKKKNPKKYHLQDFNSIAADPVVALMDLSQLKKMALETRKKMEKAARDLDFMEAATLRDEMLEIERMVLEKED